MAIFRKAAKAIEALQSDVNSIRQSGQTPVLPGTAGAPLAGYEQAKALKLSQQLNALMFHPSA